MELTYFCGKRETAIIPLLTVLVLALSACSTAGDSGELSRVQSAAALYSTELQALKNPQDTTHDQDRLKASAAILSGQPVYIDETCEADFVTAYHGYITSLSSTITAQDQSYSTMIAAVRPCSSVAAMPAPLKTGTPGATVAPEPAAATVPQKNTDVASALQKYFAGIQDIASATSVSEITAATSSIEDSADKLSDALKAPALVKPSLSLINKLVGLALQNMQYQALREVVVKMDPFLNAAAPILGADMRLTQGKNLQYAASNASSAAGLVNSGLAALKTQPADRLMAFTALSTSLDDANTVYISLAKDDPAKIVSDLISAHHDLATALVRTNINKPLSWALRQL